MEDIIKSKVCIVGLGPAGIGAALTISKSHLAPDTICLEAGPSIHGRRCQVLNGGHCINHDPCHIISGFGGCSLFGTKISTFPAGEKFKFILGSEVEAKNKLLEACRVLRNYIKFKEINIPQHLVRKAKEIFEDYGFKYKYYDAYIINHKDLVKAYQEIFSQIKTSGISILLNTKVVDVDYSNEYFIVRASQKNCDLEIHTKYLILAIGRLGRDLLKYLNNKLNLKGIENYMDVGVRIEFPIDAYPDIDVYHKDLKLLFDNARTFCVCKGGKVITYHINGIHFTEGTIYSDYTEFTNLAILVRIDPPGTERIYEEIRQRILEISNGRPIYQSLNDYLSIDFNFESKKVKIDVSNTYWVPGNIDYIFPEEISKKIKIAVRYFVSKLLPKKYWAKTFVFAPELDYGGLCFSIGPDFSVHPNLYLIGDCTGKFRGILQAFCSGIICAENIIKRDKK